MALAVLLCVVTQVSVDCPLTFLTPLLINTLLHFLLIQGNALSFKAHPLIKMVIVYLWVKPQFNIIVIHFLRISKIIDGNLDKSSCGNVLYSIYSPRIITFLCVLSVCEFSSILAAYLC